MKRHITSGAKRRRVRTWPAHAFLLAAVAFSSACSWHRIGDFNMVSTRNIDMDQSYVLIDAHQVGRANSGEMSLEVAIDNMVKHTPGGEFVMNAKIYVKQNGKKIKVEADIWGIPEPQTKTATTDLAVGDWVSWPAELGRFKQGEIIGLGADGALIRISTETALTFRVHDQKERTVQKPFEHLTRITTPSE